MYSVMIVDDMDIVRREIKRMSIWGEKSGFQISSEARNGQEALDLLKARDIDLIITDIKMPKVDGLELLQKVNEMNLSTCVVLLSDYSDFNFARKGLVLGAFDYLSKPADRDNLLDLLHRVQKNIEEKKRESERLKMLEEKLEEKVNAFFPDTDVDQLNTFILDGDRRSKEMAERIVEFSAASLDGDPIRIEFLLKNVLTAIIRSVLEKRKWLSSFVELNEIDIAGSLQSDTIEELKQKFTGKVEGLQSMLDKLECGRHDSEVVNRMCSFVLENIDGELSLKLVAERMFMNRTYLSEVFRQKTGMQFIEYLTMVKMERAKMLLTDGRLKTYEIADKLGFKDIEYFSRLFKRYTGMPPVEYRQNNAI